jgi:hypothetical protein
VAVESNAEFRSGVERAGDGEVGESSWAGGDDWHVNCVGVRNEAVVQRNGTIGVTICSILAVEIVTERYSCGPYTSR